MPGRRWKGRTGSLTRLEWLAVAAIVAGAAIRALWVFVFHQPFDHVYSDMLIYVERGQRLAAGGELVRFDASYPPGTHLLIALPSLIFGSDRDGLWGAAVLWWLMSSLTPFFMWRFARLVLTPAAAALTAIFCALWPLLITYAGYFLSDTPSTLFLAVALWLAARAIRAHGRSAAAFGAGAGLTGGFALETRPQVALNLAVVAAMLLFPWRRHLPAFATFLVAGAAALSIAIVHNSIAAGKLTAINENSGQVFWQGQCDVAWVYYGPENRETYSFAAPAALQRGGGTDYRFLTRQPWDQGAFYRDGLDCVRENGPAHLRILGRSLVDMTATTVPWPQSNEPELKEFVNLTNVLYSIALPVILFQSFLLIRRRRREGGGSGELLMLLHLACGFATALIFLGDPRYRIPYDVFGLALLAALLADAFLDRRERRESVRAVAQPV